jgi:hypothetical protein
MARMPDHVAIDEDHGRSLGRHHGADVPARLKGDEHERQHHRHRLGRGHAHLIEAEALLIDDQRQRARVVDRLTAGQSTDIWDVAPPIMNDLSKRLQESCFAAVLDQDSVIYVARATSNQRVNVGISISSQVRRTAFRPDAWCSRRSPQDLLHKYLQAMTLTRLTRTPSPRKVQLRGVIDEVRLHG